MRFFGSSARPRQPFVRKPRPALAATSLSELVRTSLVTLTKIREDIERMKAELPKLRGASAERWRSVIEEAATRCDRARSMLEAIEAIEQIGELPPGEPN